MGERVTFSTNGTKTTGYPHAKEFGPLPQTIYTTHSKWIKDLNLRTENYKTLRRKHSVNFGDFRFNSGFLAMIPKVQATTTK